MTQLRRFKSGRPHSGGSLIASTTMDGTDDGDGLDVQTPDDMGGGPRDPDEMTMEERITVAIEELETLRDDPENVTAIGMVVVTKEAYKDRNGEMGYGLAFQALTDTLEGFEHPEEVVADLSEYQTQLEGLGVPVESKERGHDPLAALFGE